MTAQPTEHRAALVPFFIALSVLTVIAMTLVWLVLDQLGPADPSAGALFTIIVLMYVIAVAATAFRYLWNPMLTPWPPREPAPDAERRNFQSFSLGIVNMGFSINVAADEEFLHLAPLSVWQALGASAASIPWSAMSPVGRTGRIVRLGGHDLYGPAWCLRRVNERMS